jgi:hypothetical protein
VTNAPRLPGSGPGRAGSIENGWNTRVDTGSRHQSQALVRLRRQRQAEKLHRLGPRVLYELLEQLDRDHGLGADLDRQLERFAGLNRALLRALGGDRFAPLPLRLVGSSQ